jgi:hypothetical protein
MTTIYRKPTHTQSYRSWRSNHPKGILLGTLKGLIHRAHTLIDKKEDLLHELSLLEDVFISNGYPQKLVQKTIKDSWSIETTKALKQIERPQPEVSEFYDVLHAPYVERFSEMVQRQLKKINIGFVPQKGLTIQSLVCNLKPSTPPERDKNVIYGLKCSSCNLWYIGETGQRFETRRKQHQGDVRRGVSSNAFYCHLRSFPDHSIDWQNFRFLKKEPMWDRRKFIESIFINSLNPSQKISAILNIEKGKDIDDCWREFGKEIRQNVFSSLKLNSYVEECKTNT